MDYNDPMNILEMLSNSQGYNIRNITLFRINIS